MLYTKGTVFHKFHKDFLITEVTDETVEFMCLEKNASGYNRCVKMDIPSFEKSLEGSGIWETVKIACLPQAITINIEDLF